MSELLASRAVRLEEDGNLWRVVVRKEILDWLMQFREHDRETYDSVISRLIDHEIALREKIDAQRTPERE
jgi:hypothetical protein